jgi:hypothetical protein
MTRTTQRSVPMPRGIAAAVLLCCSENIPRVKHPLAVSWQMSEGIAFEGVNSRGADDNSRRMKRPAARRALQSLRPLRELGNRTVSPADRVRAAKRENVMCVPSVRSAMILVTDASGGRSREQANKYRPLKIGLPPEAGQEQTAFGPAATIPAKPEGHPSSGAETG